MAPCPWPGTRPSEVVVIEASTATRTRSPRRSRPTRSCPRNRRLIRVVLDPGARPGLRPTRQAVVAAGRPPCPFCGGPLEPRDTSARAPTATSADQAPEVLRARVRERARSPWSAGSLDGLQPRLPGHGHVRTSGRVTAIYKPVAGERPLWDFPDGTLAGREVAAYLVSEAGRLGRRARRPSCGRGRTARVGPALGGRPRRAAGVRRRRGRTRRRPRGLAPGAERRRTRRAGPSWWCTRTPRPWQPVAVFDAVINNATARAPPGEGGRRGAGVRPRRQLHAESKLRTVLWGFAGRPLPGTEIAAARQAGQPARGSVAAVVRARGAAHRCRGARPRGAGATTPGAAGVPAPGKGWPAIPWPPL